MSRASKLRATNRANSSPVELDGLLASVEHCEWNHRGPLVFVSGRVFSDRPERSGHLRRSGASQMTARETARIG